MAIINACLEFSLVFLLFSRNFRQFFLNRKQINIEIKQNQKRRRKLGPRTTEREGSPAHQSQLLCKEKPSTGRRHLACGGRSAQRARDNPGRGRRKQESRRRRDGERAAKTIESEGDGFRPAALVGPPEKRLPPCRLSSRRGYACRWAGTCCPPDRHAAAQSVSQPLVHRRSRRSAFDVPAREGNLSISLS